MLRTASINQEYDLWQSPIGWIGVVAGAGRIVDVIFEPDRDAVLARISQSYPEATVGDGGLALQAIGQIEEYFHGDRSRFDLPLDLQGFSSFTATVLTTLREIPFGETLTYGELAALAGRPGAARAVGRAMAVNPFPLIIPCHRVLGAGGRMVGYSGGEGIATKEWLLRFESGKGRQPEARLIKNAQMQGARNPEA